MTCFTPFSTDISHIALPETFTFPFCYEPHPLSQVAAEQLQQHLESQTDWQHDFGFEENSNEAGKMFGVLVVKNTQGELGFLSAFSGKLADKNHLPHFVPPVFDMLTEGSFFLEGTAPINVINHQIKQLEADPELALLQQTIRDFKQQAQQEMEVLRLAIIESRKQRKALRKQAESHFQNQSLNDEALQAIFTDLSRQSVAEKAQQKNLKAHWQQQIEEVEQQLQQKIAVIEQLKQDRKQQSAKLQQKLFSQYQFLNQEKKSKSLLDIFKDNTNPIPPAGSGECAAPKLLQYAFAQRFTPICLAEFWWGASPKSEIRQHKKFYPACQSKCQPILSHMLEGIKLDDNPLLKNHAEGQEINIIYLDEAIVVVNKPTEFLSVPGVNVKDSVYTRLQALYPDVEGPFVLHRLDMSTSGLLVFALTKRANKSLQKQFITRSVEKRYVALLDGKLAGKSGDIGLPLRGDLEDRPRQMVCFEHGKPAETHWQLIETRTINDQEKSKVYLYPKTGRTHQLRVHCAHQDGLNMPIVGDDLYGEKANRLHLHAQRLAFEHPYTKEKMVFEVEAGF
ncbi:RluA family pseudouridine synthase [Vibrio algivorus]|uniref:RNA pseudouridine synthase n=1 Tax=Vibrio algivorus TaxID=1667024 RepID=A0A557NZC0_9VIBR|nr:RluA family pseudouridine synthase [Vibrio algivorus]TVO33762.1 RNA pseudouridine synthase [Vibrio algivorus]